jgi:hypothetical protein
MTYAMEKVNIMKMRVSGLLFALAIITGINFQSTTTFGQGTAFTYQGSLNFNGVPASGNYDFQFIVFTTSQYGFPAAPILTNQNISVDNGLFAVTLDFGSGILNGTNLWLDVGVRTNGSSSFTDLTPRQPLTPAPYAVFANTASNLSGSVPVAQLSGIIPLALLPSAVVTNNATSVTLSGVFTGDGSGLQYTVTARNYVGAFGITSQMNASVNTFQNITFDATSLDGWTYLPGTASFICKQSGIYLVEYSAEVETTVNGATAISLRAFNGATAYEISGSQSTVSLAVANLPSQVSKSFLASVGAGDALQFQFTASSTSAELVAGSGVGVAKPSFSCTLIRIQ